MPFGISRRRPQHFCLSLLCILAAALALTLTLMAPAANAQEAAAQSAPTIEGIQTQLQRIADSTEIDEALKARLTDLYEQAAAQLRTAAEFAERAAQFEAAQAEAPERLAAIEAELAQPPPAPDEDVSEEATLAELEQLLGQTDTELAAARQDVETLEREPAQRAERRRVIPDQLNAARQRLEEARGQLQAAPPAEEAPALTEAARTLAAARVQALEHEIALYDKELLSYEARSTLLTRRQARAARRAAYLTRKSEYLRERIAAMRRQEARAAEEHARQVLLEAATLTPLVRQQVERLAEQNAALVAERTGPGGLLRRIDLAEMDLRSVETRAAQLEADFNSVEERVDVVGLTNAIGLLLRKHRTELPDVRVHRRNVANRQADIADIQIRLIEMRDQLLAVADLSAMMEDYRPHLDAVPDEQREELEAYITDLLANLQSNVENVFGDYNELFNTLIDLNIAEQQLLDTTAEFADYINRLVLWVQSSPAIHWTDFPNAWGDMLWVFDPERWIELPGLLWRDATNNIPLYALLILGALLLVAGRRQFAPRLEALSEEARRRSCTRYSITLRALLYTLVMSLPFAFVLSVLGWRLLNAATGVPAGTAAAAGLQAAAVLWLSLEAPRQVVRANGLAEAHFDWPGAPMANVRRQLRWLKLLAVPAAFLIVVLNALSDERPAEQFSRIMFIVFMLALTNFGHILFHPRRGSITEVIDSKRRGARGQLRTFWYLLALLTPLFLIGLACLGYVYTAMRLSWRLHLTICFVMGLLLLLGLVQRWLLVTRRRLAIEQARKRREALKAARESGEGDVDLQELEEEELDLAMVDTQTQRLVQSSLLFAMIMGIWVIWAEVLPALGFLDRVTLWEVGEEAIPITLKHLLFAVLITFITTVAVRNLPGLLEIALLQRLGLASGERFAITTIVRYIIVFTGIVVIFNMIGLGWSKLQWLVAALSVGLGFGLQEIFANFISGLILLFERPIRVGDIVTVGGVSGTVSRIRMRATWITDFDRKELVVPNKEFITGQLVNWTLSDAMLRIVIPIGLAYGSKTELAIKKLLAIAQANPTVLKDPGPSVYFIGFGDNSLNFELRVFSPDIDSFLTLRHDLLLAIDKEFREAGIEIAFPQRDIHIRSIDASLPIVQNERAAAATEAADAAAQRGKQDA